MSKLNYEHVFNTLVEETAKYITKNNLKAMVLGISGGMLSELMWCVNHRVPMFLAYKSANGLGIYSTEIDENLNFKGIAGTADNFYQIVNGQFGTIVASNPFTGVLRVNNDGGYTIQDEGVYLKGELLGDPLDFLNVEQPKSYFY